MSSWTPTDSAALYGLDRWGEPYFSVNGRGHISVQPQGERGGSLDLLELVQGLLNGFITSLQSALTQAAA